jgi:hypothetical protein
MENYNATRRLTVEKQEIDKVELRSEEVRDILGAVPHWTIRSGAVYLFVLILLVLMTSWFIRYPDVLKAPVVLTSKVPPVGIVARNSGYLTLLVEDNIEVRKHQYLGYLSESDNAKSVILLLGILDTFKTQFYRNTDFLFEYIPNEQLILGELQDPYSNFTRAVYDFQLLNKQKSYQQQITALHHQKNGYETLKGQLIDRNIYNKMQLDLSKENYRIDSMLHHEKIFPEVEFRNKKRLYLRERQDYKNALMNITNNEITVADLEHKIQDLKLQEQMQNQNSLKLIESTLKQLESRLVEWEKFYLLKAPINGKVAFFAHWTDHEYITSGDEILTIVSDNSQYFCKASVPIAGSGKIMKGQKVNIKLDNFPFEEYGMLIGEVGNISQLSRENAYSVIIELPDGLNSTYNMQLAFKHEMAAQAEIITEDLRLLERFFHQIRSVINR